MSSNASADSATEAAIRRIAWFVAIGVVATLVHYGSVVALVGGAGWRPVPANVVGWLAAFVCSFLGHSWKTFRGHGVDTHVALRRFFAISAIGFAANQTGYAALLQFTGVRYDIAVLLVALAVAVLTYLLSRHWAFRAAPR